MELLDRLTDATIIVPALWHVELANALLQGEQRKRIDGHAIAEFIALLAGLAIDTDSGFDHREMGSLLALARRCRLTGYDACYLELAVRRNLPLATRDKELRRAARTTGVALIDA